MFREMRRIKQQLPEARCVTLLKNARRAVLSVNGDDGYPYGVPINFHYDESNGKIYFHGAKAGHKFDALSRDPKVCLTIFDEGFRRNGEWAYNVHSVVVFGKVRMIQDQDEAIFRVRRMAERYYPSQEDIEREIEAAASRMQMFELEIEHMTGKLVNES